MFFYTISEPFELTNQLRILAAIDQNGIHTIGSLAEQINIAGVNMSTIRGKKAHTRNER